MFNGGSKSKVEGDTMVVLIGNQLVFTFPEVHPKAKLTIEFQRTLRIPDDGRDYPLPAGWGNFPIEHVDDYASRVPHQWLDFGGVLLPMWQAEAMWISFDSAYVSPCGKYPFAVKIAAGKINAVTGSQWKHQLQAKPQDYVIIPKQPWLDGFCVERGTIRQFVAMRTGEGYTAEEQIVGMAEFGGLQIIAYPMKRMAFDRRFPPKPPKNDAGGGRIFYQSALSPTMGMGLGGRMRQEIYEDPYEFDEWDLDVSSRCFVHLADANRWTEITGKPVPTKPPTAKQYANAGIPWFTWYDEESNAVTGSVKLNNLQSVVTLGKTKGQPIENEPILPEKIVNLRAGLKQGQVREGSF
jgi:hypothetical protein